MPTETTIYFRMKASKDAKGNWRADENGGWRFLPVPTGQGRPPVWLDAALKTAAKGDRGFQFRLSNGNWSEQFESTAKAQTTAQETRIQHAAAERGLTPAEAANPANAVRTPLKTAIDAFLDKKRINESSHAKYTYVLTEFFNMLPRSIRFVDQAESALTAFLLYLEANNAAPKTIADKILIVCFMLKAAGVTRPSKLIELPAVEDEEPNPYADEDLRKMFAAMDEEEYVRYRFFLDTACRESEVAHAQWSDIDWKTREYVVRSKEWKSSKGLPKKFSLKSHQSRRTPLTRELLDILSKRQKRSSSPWIFTNEEGQPEGHFLRKFKKIAYSAGLNCGQCQAGCADEAEGCEKHYLHRLRSTRITFWLHEGVDVKTVMRWAGHKKMETTQIYAGVRETSKLQTEINAPMF